MNKLKLDEIKARFIASEGVSYWTVYEDFKQIRGDIAALIAEVERLRARVEELTLQRDYCNDHATHAMERVRQLEARQRWVPVEEELPYYIPDGLYRENEVLLRVDSGERFLGVWEPDGYSPLKGGGWRIGINRDATLRPDRVTDWLRPWPPEEEGEKG